MSFNQLLALKAFVRVVETGSFSTASRQLGLPRSTVSKLIADLEDHVASKLLQRTTRSVAPTSEGLEYFSHVTIALAQLHEADEVARNKKLQPRGHLRVEAPSSFACSQLAPALPEFQRLYPEVRVSLGVGDRAINIVGESVDCAIRAGSMTEEGLVAKRLADIPYVTCAAPDYLRRRGTPASPEDLTLSHDLVGYFFSGSGKTEPLAWEAKGRRVEAPHAAYCANDGQGVLALLLSGIGVGQPLLPAAQPHLNSGALVRVLEDWQRPALAMHMIYPPNRQQSAALKAFIEWGAARFG